MSKYKLKEAAVL